MTWLNWHAPVITPAQAVWAFVGVIVLNIALKFWDHFIRDRSISDPVEGQFQADPKPQVGSGDRG